MLTRQSLLALAAAAPGTRMPSASSSALQLSANSVGSSLSLRSSSAAASTHDTISLREAAMAACCSALMTDRYESVRPVYLPTSAMVTVSVRLSTLAARCCALAGAVQHVARCPRIRRTTAQAHGP